MNRKELYIDDLMTGLVAALVTRAEKRFDTKNHRIERALEASFPHITEEATKHGLTPQFRLRRHPVHGDSAEVTEGMCSLIREGYVKINPRLPLWEMEINMSHGQAKDFLSRLPGDPQLYEGIAKEFLSHYFETKKASSVQSLA